jgi:two-component system response regulator HydG
VRGAFTGAHKDRVGRFELANGGTLFLDEVGEIPLALQSKLLRVLQEGEFEKVGDDKTRTVDVRIVAATNRDLETDVAEHRFREDLYYRVNVVRVHVPPLRARGNDILLIAQEFIKLFAQRSAKAVRGISSQAAEKLLAYEWPGNVRELQNCIERGIALTQFEQLTVDDLPAKVRDYRSTQLVLATENLAELISLEELERRYVVRVLRAMSGNKTLTAQVLGVDRRTLYRRLEKYGGVEPEAASAEQSA